MLPKFVGDTKLEGRADKLVDRVRILNSPLWAKSSKRRLKWEKCPSWVACKYSLEELTIRAALASGRGGFSDL